jgi:hypothetical protein
MIRARIGLREQTDALPSWLLPPTFLSYARSSDTASYLSYATPSLILIYAAPSSITAAPAKIRFVVSELGLTLFVYAAPY